MFFFSRHPIPAAFSEISSGRQVLLEDDIGMPLLFTGYNIYGLPVVSSSLTDDYDEQVSRYVDMVLSQADFVRYTSGQIAFTALLAEQPYVIIRDVDYKVGETRYFMSRFEDIPASLLPLSGAYCPAIAREESIGSYVLKATGGKADRHQLPTGVHGLTERYFADVVDQAFGPIAQRPSTVALPPVSSSFSINIALDFSSIVAESLFVTDKSYIDFLDKYLTYCLKFFSRDVRRFASFTSFESDEFEGLFGSLLELVTVNRLSPTRAGKLRKALFRRIVDSAGRLQDISELSGDGFRAISVYSKTIGFDTPLGTLDRVYKQTLEEPLVNAYSFLGEQLNFDESPKTYHVQIYHLNTNSRRGNAYATANGRLFQPRINIAGENALENSPYTDSLHRRQMIAVNGVGKYIGNTLRELRIIGLTNYAADALTDEV